MQVQTLYMQEGGKCFICKNHLSLVNGCVEHIIPLSKNGKSTPDNLILMCKKMNELLCDYGIKRKLEIILNQADHNGVIQCPMTHLTKDSCG